MIHFLRNLQNDTIIECSVYSNDLRSSVDIETYSYHLLKQTELQKRQFIEDINNLSQLRGAWWERYEDSNQYKSIDAFVKEQYKIVADRWDLLYITD
jgi:hypothetical protein